MNRKVDLLKSVGTCVDWGVELTVYRHPIYGVVVLYLSWYPHRLRSRANSIQRPDIRCGCLIPKLVPAQIEE